MILFISNKTCFGLSSDRRRVLTKFLLQEIILMYVTACQWWVLIIYVRYQA